MYACEGEPGEVECGGTGVEAVAGEEAGTGGGSAPGGESPGGVTAAVALSLSLCMISEQFLSESKTLYLFPPRT